MNTQKWKLTLNKETLRDLTTQNAGDVKGGKKTVPNTHGKKCLTVTCDPYPDTYFCW